MYMCHKVVNSYNVWTVKMVGVEYCFDIFVDTAFGTVQGNLKLRGQLKKRLGRRKNNGRFPAMLPYLPNTTCDNMLYHP